MFHGQRGLVLSFLCAEVSLLMAMELARPKYNPRRRKWNRDI